MVKMTDDKKITVDTDSKIIMINEINEETTKVFTEQFFQIQNSGQEVIPIFINSYGGNVEDLMAMVDLIKSTNLVVCTIALGKAYSAGAVLLSSGTKGFRFVSPRSTIMLHNISGGVVGQLDEMITSTKEAKRMDGIIFELLDENCGKEKGYFKKLLKTKPNTDFFMSPKEAVRHSLADKVKVPTFSLDVNINFFIS